LKILIIEMNGSKKTHCWTSLVTRSIALKASTRVPTQITCKFLKSVPSRWGRVVRIAALGTFSPVRVTAYRLKGGAL
jgi:hypothetical protein